MSKDFLRPVDLDDTNVARLIVRLGLPSIAGLSINALHHLANAVFVGTLGPESIAAVSIAFPVVILLAAIGQGVGIGTASYISRMLGAGRVDKASQAATTAIMLVIPLGLILTAMLLLNLEQILTLFGATDTILPFATAYTRVLILSYTVMLLNITSGFIVRSEGNARFSMWTMVTAFLLNIIFDPIFIFVFELGVAGAALATLVAQIVAASAYAIYFAISRGTVEVRLSLFKPAREILGQIVAVGAPAMLASALTALALVLIYSTAGFYGDAAVAGVGIALRLFTIGALPVMGLCDGAQAVLGFSWGAGGYGRVLRAVRFMVLLTSGFALTYSLVMTLFAYTVVTLFTNDAQVLEIGTTACVAFHSVFAFFGLQMVLTTLLRSIGKARLAAFVALAPHGYFLIPSVLLLPKIWELNGLIASYVLAEGLASALAIGIMLWQIAEVRVRMRKEASDGYYFSTP